MIGRESCRNCDICGNSSTVVVVVTLLVVTPSDIITMVHLTEETAYGALFGSSLGEKKTKVMHLLSLT
jgi:hypothetical protein